MEELYIRVIICAFETTHLPTQLTLIGLLIDPRHNVE